MEAGISRERAGNEEEEDLEEEDCEDKPCAGAVYREVD